MNETEKKAVIDRYSRRLHKHGYHPETLGWTKGKHVLRYHILLSQFNLNGKTLLDFGCGFGDLYDYIQRQKITVNYEGVDINPDLIKEGKIIYPNLNLRAVDVFKEGLKKKYDFIVSSGVHNLKLRNNKKFIRDTFEIFNKLSKEGFALNFLSDQVDFRKKDIHYSNPAEIIELAYKYSRRVVLRNDYMPFEFTVFIDKRASFNKASVVYPEFEKYLLQDLNTLKGDTSDKS